MLASAEALCCSQQVGREGVAARLDLSMTRAYSGQMTLRRVWHRAGMLPRHQLSNIHRKKAVQNGYSRDIFGDRKRDDVREGIAPASR